MDLAALFLFAGTLLVAAASPAPGAAAPVALAAPGSRAQQ